MRKILVLFLVFVFVSVKESNASNFERVVWTLGSSVNVTLGPEDAVHCRLKANTGTTVYDGFGPCRLVLDRVRREHRGSWELFVGTPGTITVPSSWLDVDVVAPVDSTPVVTTSVVRQQLFVNLTCSVPEEYQVQSCTFRNPSGTVFIASPGVNQDSHQPTRYESYAERNNCKLSLLMSYLEKEGIWRCAVNTTVGIGYGFLDTSTAAIDNYNPPLNTWPELETKYNGISGTEGDALTMACSIGTPVRYCYFRAPNGTVFNVAPSTSTADYEYVGNGFDAGECGIRFNSIWTSAQGQWSCNVGLKNTSYLEEKRDYFNVYVNERLMVYHRWQDNKIVVRLRIAFGPEIEYCRFVRSDGLGFVDENAIHPYFTIKSQMYGTCTLYIESPTAVDLRPWTVVAKLSDEDEEVSVTTRLERPPSSGGLTRNGATFLWCLFGSIFVFLIVASFLPKKNREWTHQRAARIRNSFRRQPHPQPQPQPQQHNVANLTTPVYVDILTDLPRKV